MKKLKSTLRITLLSFLIFINIGCDQVTKKVAQDNLSFHQEKTYLDGHFRLIYAENEGAMLSLGSDWHPVLKGIFLIGVPVVALIFLIGFTFFNTKISLNNALALSFIIGGGASNIYDRMANGKVVDFLHLSYGDWQTGIFNFADVAILLGMFWFLIFKSTYLFHK